MSKNSPIVEIDNDKIAIYTDYGAEIVMWDVAEWLEDPDVVVSIANAIHFAYDQGTVALIEKLHPGYVEGFSCPQCFSEDTETILDTRENRCLSCNHQFSLPENLAQELELQHPGFDIELLSEHAQAVAFLTYQEHCTKYNIPAPAELSAFIDLATAEDWTFTVDGKRKRNEV